MGPTADTLRAELKDIVNGSFKPKNSVYGSQYPVDYRYFMANALRPLRTTTDLLASALIALMEENGYVHAANKTDQLFDLFHEGIPLMANEFLVATYGRTGDIAQVDIITSVDANRGPANSIYKATDDQIDRAVVQALKVNHLNPSA